MFFKNIKSFFKNIKSFPGELNQKDKTIFVFIIITIQFSLNKQNAHSV
jgi:hypothetical protein